MAKHVQRKKCLSEEMAAQEAGGFAVDPIDVPGGTLEAQAYEIDGEFWCYLTHHGQLIAEPLLLPGYELVSYDP